MITFDKNNLNTTHLLFLKTNLQPQQWLKVEFSLKKCFMIWPKQRLKHGMFGCFFIFTCTEPPANLSRTKRWTRCVQFMLLSHNLFLAGMEEQSSRPKHGNHIRVLVCQVGVSSSCEAAGWRCVMMDCFSLRLSSSSWDCWTVVDQTPSVWPHGVPQPVIFLNGAPAFKHTSPQSGGLSLFNTHKEVNSLDEDWPQPGGPDLL